MVQFKSTYKKLLSHVPISVPLTANCIPDENTLLITVNYDNDEEQSNDSILQISDEDLSVISDAIYFVELNNYLIDIIGYMSRVIVRMINKKIKCDVCK